MNPLPLSKQDTIILAVSLAVLAALLSLCLLGLWWFFQIVAPAVLYVGRWTESAPYLFNILVLSALGSVTIYHVFIKGD